MITSYNASSRFREFAIEVMLRLEGGYFCAPLGSESGKGTTFVQHYFDSLMILRTYPSKRQYWFARTPRSNSRLLLWLVPALAVVLWFGYKQMESYLVPPQAIFVLGGAQEREKFAAEFARQHPHLHIWVSSGSPKWFITRIFAKAGIERSRLHLDYRAGDTVENFTTLVDELHNQGIESVYLITSDYHMRRARMIGEIVLGSRGMIIEPISVPSERSPESMGKVIRDGARAILWLTTGYTGANLRRLQYQLKK